MKIALTYDDGPSEWTAPILDTLAERDAKATFFVCGAHILGRSSILARIAEEGHEVGNHTTTHPNLTTLDADQVEQELVETALMIGIVTGDVPQVWRAPYLRVPAWNGVLRHIGCDVIPGDWAEPDPQRITDTVLGNVRDGSIVLLHDGRPPGQPEHAAGGSLDTRAATVEATRLLVPALIDAGYELVTVSDL